MLQLYTFGGLRIRQDARPLRLSTRKARDLLAYLITFRDRPHPRSVLAGMLWPALPEDRARRRLSDTLWRVRRVLDDHVMGDEKRIRFNASLPHWLDVEQFEQSIAPQIHQPGAVETLTEALQLYRGDFLEGLYHDWALLERERLRGLYVATLERLLGLHKQAGNYEHALRTAQRLTGAEPFHEAAHRELMRLYHLLGRDAEAVAQYRRCREILEQELGVEPAPETQALYRMLSQRVSSPTPVPPLSLPTPARRTPFDLDSPPLVGRDAERAALLGHLEAAASGQGGMVLLEGEAGIGKSRLAQELIAGAHWRNVHVTQAAADRSTVSSSYGLMLSALRPALSPLRIRQLSRLLEPIHLEVVAPLLPAAGLLPDSPPLPDLPPPQARRRLQQALIELVLGLARVGPQLWVLEDLHWADAETLSLLPLLQPRLAESRTLLLLTGRSAALRDRPAAWDTLQALDRTGSFPHYTLTRLEAGAICDLVHHLLGEERSTLGDHLARESEGVPLYLVEILKAWRDEGRLLHDERRGWRWQAGDSSTLPSQSGEAVIGHRLACLSPGAQEVLNAAAVIGTDVEFDLLAAVCAPALSDSGLLAATDELLRLGFLVETETGYRFGHERIRRPVYCRLPRRQRARLHRSVARALEQLDPERFELLAQHFAAADERHPAIHYLTRAAGRACELFAHQTALSCYARLLELLTHPENRAARYGVLRDRAEVLGWIGDREAQGQTLEEMLRLTRDLRDDARRAETLHRRSEWHRVQGQYERANEDARAALEIYRRMGDAPAQAALLTQLGWNVIYTADHARAADYFREALPIYESLGDLVGQINCLSGLVNAAELSGDYPLALSYLEENLALAEATGDPIRISRAHHNRGVVHYDLGDLDAAEADLRQALALKETTGDRRSQALTHFYLGAVETERSDLEAAQAHLDTAREILREVQDISWEGDTRAALGRLALLQGDPATAEGHLEVAYRRCLELGECSYAVIHLSYLALAELALGDRESAWERSQEAVAGLEAGLAGVEHPQRIYYNHHRVAAATRHWAAARAALEAAARIVARRAERIDAPLFRETYRTGLRVNRAITEALAAQPPPGHLRVRLARADVPAHRQPAPEEWVPLVWTVDAGQEEAALAGRLGQVALRRHRLLRLLAEAEAAGTLPAVADLAGALEVSARTIRSDLAALREQGHPARTRGHRA